MSATVPPATNTAAKVNSVIADAKSMPQLVAGLEKIDPTLAASLKDKALLASKTPWGTIAVAGAAWLSSHYGLGWGPEFDTIIGGAGVLLGSYVMRAVSTGPISGVFRKPAAVDAPAPPAPTN